MIGQAQDPLPSWSLARPDDARAWLGDEAPIEPTGDSANWLPEGLAYATFAEEESGFCIDGVCTEPSDYQLRPLEMSDTMLGAGVKFLAGEF